MLTKRSILRFEKMKETFFIILGLIFLSFSVLIFSSIIFHMLMEGYSRLDPSFFFRYSSHYPERAGIFPAWVGSLCIISVVFIVSVPVGIISSIYLEEFAPKNFFLSILEVNLANLAGVPSIVYGLLGLSLFVYHLHLGRTIISAGLTLSLLVLPIIVVTAREAISQVPNSLREAAYALGATKWEVIKHHVVPYALPNIVTGVILALSRALSETAPLVAIGAAAFLRFLPESPIHLNFPFFNMRWLYSEFSSLPLQVFNWTNRPERGFQINAAAASLVLIIMTFFLNAASVFLRYHLRKKLKR
ncbi:phosphate ABC transporter permease PstA [Candidatus Ichthyocystis sparus]|uniref:phosphate ABC transporter permease PstA n=1 Tax=Candidatus Ichthyocystis sparus TaxID=1561004 RepID=UPI000B10C0A4|nr:phosphate ABC transporter permease PstA [Candidatus Ichthyocystis sparus]